MDHEDLEQIDEYDLEEMDLKWQSGHDLNVNEKVLQEDWRRDAWNSRNKDGSRTRQKEDSKALVTIDGEGGRFDNLIKMMMIYALMAYNSSGLSHRVLHARNKGISQGLKKVESNVSCSSIRGPTLNVNLRSGSDAPIIEGMNQIVYINLVTVELASTKKFSTARQSVNRQTVLTSTAMKVNTVKPIVNRVRPANVFHKTHSPSSRPFKKTTVLRTDFSKQKVNTAKVNAVSTVGGKRETAVKPSAGCNWRPQRYHGGSKYNGGSSLRNYYPHRALKNKGIVDSGCSRHMTGNKAYLDEFQDFNGGPVAFEGSKGYITGKEMCDKKNKVLFTDSECLVLSSEFKLPDENQEIGLFIAKGHNEDLTNGIGWLGHVNSKLKHTCKGNPCKWFTSQKIFHNGTTLVLLVRKESNTKPPVRPNQNSQQKWVAERKNKTLIEAARTMLADSFLPNTFWAEAVSTACYVLNRVLVTKPHNKTPYELLTGKGPTWLFDLDYLTDSMNYHPVRSENQANIHAGQQEANHHADEKREGPREEEQVFLDELERLKRQEKEANEEAEALRKQYAQENKNLVIQAGAAKASSTNIFSTVSTPAKASSTNLCNIRERDIHVRYLIKNSPDGIFTTSSYDAEGAVADFTNLESIVNVSPIPTSRIISSHPSALILGDPTSAQENIHKDFQDCLFACFLSLNEPKKISEALEDECWVDAMQEELLQFKIQKGHRQEEGIDYNEVFAPVAKIEAIRIFLAFASYMGFIVYQMDVKSAFLYGKIDEEVYMSQPPGFQDPKYPQKVYKVVKALYGLH
ncbi:retrovirus-related pol polyprotein from transposon TNT 1-94 [Tanacetum coccineum]